MLRMVMMKMGQKHLHELLKEDQEPFLLNSYVADRSFGSVRTKQPAVSIQQRIKPKKQRPVFRNSILTGNIRKGSCFSSSPGSPDNKRSCPVRFNVLQSPDSVVSIQVPPKTAALLLKAALRIQNSPPRNQARPSGGIPGLRLFGSLLKRLTSRNLTEKLKRRSDGEWYCCSSPGSEPTNSIFSGITEDVGIKPQSVLSGFRFLLQRVIHSGCHLPEVTSTTTSSPVRRVSKDNGRSDQDNLTKLMVDEEEEEHCSPVCVLDPPFEDEEDEDARGHHQDCSDDCFDYENSFAVVQKAKQELLERLYRFEKLAELDPTELEKLLIEQDSEEDGEINEPECAGFLFEMCCQEQENIPINIPIATKMTKLCCSEEQDTLMMGLCKRLQIWNEANFDKIDMVVERDLREDYNGWIKTDEEQVIEAAKEIEVAIFGMMLQQLTEDLL